MKLNIVENAFTGEMHLRNENWSLGNSEKVVGQIPVEPVKKWVTKEAKAQNEKDIQSFTRCGLSWPWSIPIGARNIKVTYEVEE